MSLTNFSSLKKHILSWEKEGLISTYQRESLFLHTEEKIRAAKKKITRLFLYFLGLIVLLILCSFYFLF